MVNLQFPLKESTQGRYLHLFQTACTSVSLVEGYNVAYVHVPSQQHTEHGKTKQNLSKSAFVVWTDKTRATYHIPLSRFTIICRLEQVIPFFFPHSLAVLARFFWREQPTKSEWLSATNIHYKLTDQNLAVVWLILAGLSWTMLVDSRSVPCIFIPRQKLKG